LLRSVPPGRSILGEFFPTPTLDAFAVFTRSAQTAQAQGGTSTPIVTASATFLPLPTFTPTLELSTPTPQPPTPTDTPLPLTGAACLPKDSSQIQTGKALDIIDGNTIKVLMNDKVYVVRYIGIAAPDAESPYSQAASMRNGELVFARDITLIRDVTDKDASGYLLRYVLVGETFVNLELIQLGLATAIDSAPDSACADVFKSAEQAAIAAQIGLWIPAP
jgi:endonuclease YncB( thermonuclease family)